MSLTVTDAWGDCATTTRVVTIGEPAGNLAAGPGDQRRRHAWPVNCTFSGVGTVRPERRLVHVPLELRRRHDDGTSANPSQTFAGAGTYTVTLTVTDGWGDAASTSRSVTVT